MLLNQTAICKDEGTHILIVEGKDDCHGILQFVLRTGLSSKFGIWAGDSDGKALARFSGLLAATPSDRPRALGLVLDCDRVHEQDGSGLRRRWQQIEARLINLGYQLPAEPHAEGTIVQSPVPGELPVIGIWIMPDNSAEGMFEDFLLNLVPAPTVDFAREVVRRAKAEGHATFNPLHEAKAIAHTVLAWRDEPGRPIGIAMKIGVFDVEHPLAIAFNGWLGRLFVGAHP